MGRSTRYLLQLSTCYIVMDETGTSLQLPKSTNLSTAISASTSAWPLPLPVLPLSTRQPRQSTININSPESTKHPQPHLFPPSIVQNSSSSTKKPYLHPP
ncbi:uncharacterized protein BDV17DRAFT_85955 [Aspergillus undulatus]|uniref:uncharacterized protein n=1 Tax=Aspergillus undulatus TaxID=1810928 RepID=UPI003CCD11AD